MHTTLRPDLYLSPTEHAWFSLWFQHFYTRNRIFRYIQYFCCVQVYESCIFRHEISGWYCAEFIVLQSPSEHLEQGSEVSLPDGSPGCSGVYPGNQFTHAQTIRNWGLDQFRRNFCSRIFRRLIQEKLLQYNRTQSRLVREKLLQPDTGYIGDQFRRIPQQNTEEIFFRTNFCSQTEEPNTRETPIARHRKDQFSSQFIRNSQSLIQNRLVQEKRLQLDTEKIRTGDTPSHIIEHKGGQSRESDTEEESSGKLIKQYTQEISSGKTPIAGQRKDQFRKNSYLLPDTKGTRSGETSIARHRR